MKKRVLSLVLCLVMVFSLLPVSSMAMVYPVGSDTSMLVVQFCKNGTAFNEQRVAKGDVRLYDPGCDVEGEEIFSGWRIAGQDVNLPVNAEGDAASITKYVSDNYDDLAQNSPLVVNAVLDSVHYLIYMDEHDRVLKTDYALGTANYKTTVDLDYVPADAQKDFFGWETHGENPAQYKNGTEITLSAATTTLYPIVQQGYWLSFDANIDQDADPTKATFTAPQLYVGTDRTKAPDPAPTRPGYRLEGWYTDKSLASNTKYNFNQTLSNDLTLYAKWEPSGTVKYQVVIWKQKTTDDPYAKDADKTYDYAAGPSETRTAQAGSTVSITSEDTNLARNATRNITMGTNEKWNFFTYNANNTDTGSVLVKGDGSTVLNVYYDRVPITINFWTNSSTNTLYYNNEITESGPSYTYDDPWATGYYMIGKDGPLGADWRPTGGETLYSYDDLRKEEVTDSEYKGDYYEFSTSSPNANNIYSSSDSKFTWYDGTLYHQHGYWLSTRQFAQFYYYENQSGTYPVGQGPQPDNPGTGGATSGTHYYYSDTNGETGYYRIGNPTGPRGDWTPQNGDTIYISRYPYWDKWNPTSGWSSSNGVTGNSGPDGGTDYDVVPEASATGNYAMYAYTYDTSAVDGEKDNYNYGPTDSNDRHYNFHWYNGKLYVYARPAGSNHCYRAAYYYYKNLTGYYEVGKGPDPTAPGTANVRNSSYTGLYGAEFNDWIRYDAQGREIEWGLKGSDNSYPMPVLMFDNFDEGSASAGQASTMNLYYSTTTSGRTIHYQGQTLEGGDNYEDFITFKSGGRWYPTEQFVGFTIKEYRNGTSGSWTAITPNGSIPSDSSEGYVHFTRHQHRFIMTSNNTNVVDDTLYYEAPLNTYGTSDYVPTNGPEGAYFDGWYSDPACTIPFDFDITMPDNDVRVYAKWTTMRFRVLLDPTGGDPSVEKSAITFPGNQVTAFRVDYGEKIEKNAIAAASRTGYQLVGWYSDPNFEHPFNFNFSEWDDIADFDYAAAPSAQRQGKDYWNGNADWTDADGENDDVVGKVMLYAKWRQVMGDNEFLTVNYDAAPGSISKSDTNQYADMAQAIALSAPQPPAGKVFQYWQVLNANDEPTGVTVAPGHTYNVRLADAKNNVVTLQAVYAKSDTATHITWVGNGGVTDAGAAAVTTDTEINLATDILPDDTFERSGFQFLGWARLNESDMKEGEGWKEQALTADDLFLIWDPTIGENGGFRVNSAVDSSIGSDNPVVNKIAANEVQPYHVLYAVWEKYAGHTYVIDFGAPMKVATSADEIKNAVDNVLQGANGKFVLNGANVTYQLDSERLSGKNVQINKAYSAVDEATVHGVLANVAGDKLGWKEITTVPAGSIYFDDSNINTVLTSDGSGYAATEDGNALQATPATDNTTAGMYTFTFYGTGIDIYCSTAPDGGYVQAKLLKDGNAVEGYPVQTVKNYDNNDDKITRYNVPTLSFTGLEPAEYTVTLNVLNSSNYKLDGVRVYNPVVQSTYDGMDTHEQYAAFINLREVLVNDKKSYGTTTGSSQSTHEQLGVLFVDDSSSLSQLVTATQAEIEDPDIPITYVDADGNVVTAGADGAIAMKRAYASDFAAYEKNSPKHEIYLDAPKAAVPESEGVEAQPAKEGESVVFQLTPAAENAAKAGNLWIGLSAPDAGKNAGTVTIGTIEKQVSSGVDMYYPITEEMIGTDRVVTIKNTGTSMISVTNLKITGNKDIYNAVLARDAATESAGEDAVVLSVVDAASMVFEPVTMQTVKIAANNGVDPDVVVDEPGEPEPSPTPDQPDEPTPTVNPGPQSWLGRLISNFVSYVFQSIGRLFHP